MPATAPARALAQEAKQRLGTEPPHLHSGCMVGPDHDGPSRIPRRPLGVATGAWPRPQDTAKARLQVGLVPDWWTLPTCVSKFLTAGELGRTDTDTPRVANQLSATTEA